MGRVSVQLLCVCCLVCAPLGNARNPFLLPIDDAVPIDEANFQESVRKIFHHAAGLMTAQKQHLSFVVPGPGRAGASGSPQGRHLAETSNRCAWANGACSYNLSSNVAITDGFASNIGNRIARCSQLSSESSCVADASCDWGLTSEATVCDAVISTSEMVQLLARAFPAGVCGWYGKLWQQTNRCVGMSTCGMANCKSVDINGSNPTSGQCESQAVCDRNTDRSAEVVCNGQSLSDLKSGCDTGTADERVRCVSRKCADFGPVLRESYRAYDECCPGGRCTCQGAACMRQGNQCLVDLSEIRMRALSDQCGARQIFKLTKKCVAITNKNSCASDADCSWQELKTCDTNSGSPGTTSLCTANDMKTWEIMAGGNADLREPAARLYGIYKCPGASTESACSGMSFPDFRSGGGEAAMPTVAEQEAAMTTVVVQEVSLAARPGAWLAAAGAAGLAVAAL